MTNTYTKNTPEQDYNAAMASVTLLNNGNVRKLSSTDWAECVLRNVKHLEIQVAKGSAYYGTLDLTPFITAITANQVKA